MMDGRWTDGESPGQEAQVPDGGYLPLSDPRPVDLLCLLRLLLRDVQGKIQRRSEGQGVDFTSMFAEWRVRS